MVKMLMVFYTDSHFLISILFSLSRYILVARVTDASGEAYLSLFNEEAERVIGCSADELDKLKSQVYYSYDFDSLCL